MTGRKREFSYPSQFGILIGLTGGGILLSVIVAAGIWAMMVGGSFPSTTAEILQPKYYDVNMVIQGVSTFCIFFMPALAFAAICYPRAINFLGLTKYFNCRQVLLAAAILMVTIPFAGAIGEFNKIIPLPKNLEDYFKEMESNREAQEAAFIKIDSLHKYLISLFMIGLLPAIFEETFFRGGLQNLFTKWFKNFWVSIIVTSIIFSIIHLSYYGFLVRFSLGVILGLLFHYSCNLWIPIIFHLLFNGLQVTAMYFMVKSGISKPKDIQQHFPLWLGILGLFLLVYLFRIYKHRSRQILASYVTVNEETTPSSDSQNTLADGI